MRETDKDIAVPVSLFSASHHKTKEQRCNSYCCYLSHILTLCFPQWPPVGLCIFSDFYMLAAAPFQCVMAEAASNTYSVLTTTIILSKESKSFTKNLPHWFELIRSLSSLISWQQQNNWHTNYFLTHSLPLAWWMHSCISNYVFHQPTFQLQQEKRFLLWSVALHVHVKTFTYFFSVTLCKSYELQLIYMRRFSTFPLNLKIGVTQNFAPSILQQV